MRSWSLGEMISLLPISSVSSLPVSHANPVAQLDSMKSLGTIPSFSPMHTFYWGNWHRQSVLGPECADNISPIRWCVQRGMIFTSHHGAPVANSDSMRLLSATVTHRDVSRGRSLARVGA